MSYIIDTLSAVFIAALVTTARKWKQSKHPVTNKWIMKMCHTYTVEYHSPIKKNEILNFSGKMDGTRKEHIEWGVGGNTGTEIQMPRVLSTWREREIEEMNST